LLFGIDLADIFTRGGVEVPGDQSGTEYTIPSGNTDVTNPGDTGGGANTADVTTDAGKDFVARVLGSTERVWDEIFKKMGRQYKKPNLVLFSGYVQSACGMAQAAMGPFYCPLDQKVYIDLSFYQDMKSRLGAPGDFAQAYVIAHEIGHHVQNQFGIAEKVTQARMRAPEAEANQLSVRMELQADCFAGIWAKEADATKKILEQGDIEEGLNAAAAIGDDRLQKRSTGYVVPDAFTHGSSAQRVRWFKRGLQASDLRDCDTFGTDQL
jgi:predicted metalloprotease